MHCYFFQLFQNLLGARGRGFLKALSRELCFYLICKQTNAAHKNLFISIIRNRELESKNKRTSP